jgi:phosphoribosylformylglycinamidine cyclo-ligase
VPALSKIIVPGAVDLAGGSWGIVPYPDRLINPENIADGDAIIIIESSGLHANGITTARDVATRLPDGYLTKLPGSSITYGEVLVQPTHIYVQAVQAILAAGIPISYNVNMTGHGWEKCGRPVQAWTYVIETLPEQQPIFGVIQQYAPLSDLEAYKQYNMGAGFMVYLPRAHADKAVEIIQSLGFKAFVAGHIEKGKRQVIVRPKNDMVLDCLSLGFR